MTERIDYIAITPAGAVIYTTSERDLALKWWLKNASDYPGAELRRVIVTTASQVLRRSVVREAA